MQNFSGPAKSGYDFIHYQKYVVFSADACDVRKILWWRRDACPGCAGNGLCNESGNGIATKSEDRFLQDSCAENPAVGICLFIGTPVAKGEFQNRKIGKKRRIFSSPSRISGHGQSADRAAVVAIPPGQDPLLLRLLF
jgi:hypothetical protein